MMNCGGFGKKGMPDMEETKGHILAAGKELMLAADGALKFCLAYAESFSSPSSRSQLVSFFSKAISVADELAKGLITASSKGAVKKAASPIFDALGREMARESKGRKRAPSRAKRAPAKRAHTTGVRPRRKKAVKRPRRGRS